MSVDQAHAGVRVGMEIADNLPGNVLACAAMGQGSPECAALLLSRLSDQPVRDFVVSGPTMRQDDLIHLLDVLHGAQARHRDAKDPMDVLAAFGGHEIAVMVAPCWWQPASAASSSSTASPPAPPSRWRR